MCTTTPASPQRRGPSKGGATAVTTAAMQGFDISESSSSSFQENNSNSNAIMKEDEELGIAASITSDSMTATTIDSGDSSSCDSADIVNTHFNKQQQAASSSSSNWMTFMSDLNSWRGTYGGKVVSSCAFYSFCSVSMVLTNKSLASR